MPLQKIQGLLAGLKHLSFPVKVMKTLLLQMIEIPKKVENRGKIPVNSFFNSPLSEAFLSFPLSFAQSTPLFCIKKTTASFRLVVNSATKLKGSHRRWAIGKKNNIYDNLLPLAYSLFLHNFELLAR